MTMRQNDEGVGRDVMKYFTEPTDFNDTLPYARMGLLARGLYHSLKGAAALYGRLPNNAPDLAHYARATSVEEVEAALPELLRSGLFQMDSEEQTIHCPEVERQVEAVIDKTVRKIKAGREAARRRYEKGGGSSFSQ